jgi:hypothetical protein
VARAGARAFARVRSHVADTAMLLKKSSGILGKARQVASKAPVNSALSEDVSF